jgi:hypothetical protein
MAYFGVHLVTNGKAHGRGILVCVNCDMRIRNFENGDLAESWYFLCRSTALRKYLIGLLHWKVNKNLESGYFIVGEHCKEAGGKWKVEGMK